MKGLNRIIIINSMGCARAEFNARGNVLYTGRNNLGKTAALRLWVYLYTGDRDMIGLSREQYFCEFYFPSEKNSYIIYEFLDDLGLYMYILTAKGHRIYTRIVDTAYSREYFFDANNMAFDRWEKIAEKIGPKANELPEIIGEQNFKNVLYGIYESKGKNPFKRFALVKSANTDGLRNCIQNVFLNNKKELVHTSDVKNFILQILNMTDTSIEITKLKALIKPVKAQWHDQKLWNATDKETGVKIKQRQAQDIIKTYHRLVDIESNLVLYMRMLNYIVPNNYRLINRTNDALQIKRKELNDFIEQTKKLKEDYESIMETLNQNYGKLKGRIDNIENERIFFRTKENAEIVELCMKKDEISANQERVTNELDVLNSQFKDIETKYQSLIETQTKPLVELVNKYEKECHQKKENYYNEKSEVEKKYREECQNIDQVHNETISNIDAKKETLTNEKETVIDSINKIEQFQPYGKEITTINKEIEQYQKDKAAKEEILGSLKGQLDDKRKECDNDIEKLVAAKTSEWVIKRKTLAKSIESLQNKMENIDGSLMQFLEENIPEWKTNIGKVIDDDVLYSHNTNPVVASENASLYGVNINTDAIEHTPLTPDEIHKRMIDEKEKVKRLSSFIDNPKFALQKDIEELEIRFEKQNKTLVDNIKKEENDIININGKLQGKTSELNRLTKLQDIAKQNKLNKLNEALNRINSELKTLNQERIFENGPDGWNKRKEEAQNKYDIKLKEVEAINDECKEIENKCKELNIKIEEEKQRLNNLKIQELKNEGSDTERIAQLTAQKKELDEQMELINKKQNQKLFWRYEKYLEQQAMEESTIFELDTLEKRINETKTTYNEKSNELKKNVDVLKTDIQQDESNIEMWNKGIQKVKDFNDRYMEHWPDSLITTDVEETDKDAMTITEYLSNNRGKRNTELNNLVASVGQFLKDFSDENIYHFNTKLSVADNRQYNDFRQFAEFMENFIANKKWKDCEMVGNAMYNDIIKEAFAESQETINHYYEIDNVIHDMNKQLTNLNFSNLEFIEFKRENSDNSVYRVIHKIHDFYDKYHEIIENGQMGLFGAALDETERKQIQENAINLIHQMAESLENSNMQFISLADTFELKVRGKQNGVLKPWTMSVQEIGSTGITSVSRVLINVVLIDVFKQKLGKHDDFQIHCIMDEISQVDVINRKNLFKFANDKKIYFVNAANALDEASDYKYIYLVEGNADKKICRFVLLLDDYEEQTTNTL